METRQFSPHRTPESPRPGTQRQRSNSFPIVEALGCSTPEAQLILAEGRAAVRKRRARERRNRSFDDEGNATYHPRDHIKYLTAEATHDWIAGTPYAPVDVRRSHARVSSNATDRSTSTVVALTNDSKPATMASPTSPLGNYSAHLAQFIKDQLKSIPTYQPEHDLVAILSPRSCPEFTFPSRSPPLSPPRSPVRSAARPIEPPRAIAIPPVRPPMQSAFSAWSSADDEDGDDDNASDYDELPGPAVEQSSASKVRDYAPSVLGYYAANNNSFLFSSTPIEDEEQPGTAKRSSFGPQSAFSESAESQDNNDYPSSCLSRPQLTSSSAPSISSSSGSYFECKRPLAFTPGMKNRVIAALTPPPGHGHAKTITAISPWEGNAITNVHDVHVESNQRVRVDGMSFDMLRDFVVPSRLSTPV
ncbi:hypothetical protein IQ06DRAFT_295410 [Phaeosphaeriaceae sp. SRC1lsM3a]|nr:hypothetical protein IQ06DRAFT_295410 [Stagonospora sp. SRC1lsM3a]